MSGPPFNIDNAKPAATDILSAFPANEQANRSTIEDWLTFLSDPTTGIINVSALPAAALGFDVGTKLTFVQSSAPTGWTKDITHNDKALRIVNGTAGTGGTVAFSTVHSATRTTTGVAITAAQMPSHTHGVSATTGTESADHAHFQQGSFVTDTQGNHQHGNASDGNNFVTAGGSLGSGSGLGYKQTAGTSFAGAHAHNVTISGATSGRTAAHTHSFSTTSTSAGSDQTHAHTTNLDVNYVDCIICTKN